MAERWVQLSPKPAQEGGRGRRPRTTQRSQCLDPTQQLAPPAGDSAPLPFPRLCVMQQGVQGRGRQEWVHPAQHPPVASLHTECHC